MNLIHKKPISDLGFHFIPQGMLPKGADEYYLRNKQNRAGITYRPLKKSEIKILERNLNTADSWRNVLVSDAFDPELVKYSRFFGLVRIGKLEPALLEFHAVRVPVGIYNSTIISCDIGDNVAIDHVNHLSHYIIGNEVILANINEMGTTNYAKFGNGVLKEGETESIRIWLEICNENGGRRILPFNGMLPGDAWLWSRNRDNKALHAQFKKMTEAQFDAKRGYYGKVGDHTVIKNCKIIKDVWIGSNAYIKGANKLKNITINSSEAAPSQIGEGCEMVNGIVGFGSRAFYGVKAVRFVMGSNTQLKYGARLINGFLGDNATISCCEVLNALIFPAHEQHHNNSFLCAATVMGQSNIPAGATIGSNHNSRGADGEIVAGRGFWPALCVSIKHNSKFASYTLLAKGDYPAELNIPIPFSLVSIDAQKNQLVVMPGYWMLYNMYALARNAWKYADRDQRYDKTQLLEHHFLAPDTVNEMFTALEMFTRFTGKALKGGRKNSALDAAEGKKLLDTNPEKAAALNIVAEGFENSPRETVLIKVDQAYPLFRRMIAYYASSTFLTFIEAVGIPNFKALLQYLPAKPKRTAWENVGGQLMRSSDVEKLKAAIEKNKIKRWDEVHAFYKKMSDEYLLQKLQHAHAAILELYGEKTLTANRLKQLFQQHIETKTWITEAIHQSRRKDYTNPFRKMVYESMAEMETVNGKLKDNGFIRDQYAELETTKKQMQQLNRRFFR